MSNQDYETVLVGICGFKGSGKDTVALHLCEKYGFYQLSFANILKRVTSIIFGWDYEMLLGLTEESRIKREEVDEWWTEKLNLGVDITPRNIMQFLGTDLFRDQFHKDIWVLQVERQMYNIRKEFGHTKFVISDCRFENEIEWMKLFSNHKIIHIHRDSHYYNIIDSLHISETEWLNHKCHYELLNDGTITKLYDSINKLDFL